MSEQSLTELTEAAAIELLEANMGLVQLKFAEAELRATMVRLVGDTVSDVAATLVQEAHQLLFSPSPQFSKAMGNLTKAARFDEPCYFDLYWSLHELDVQATLALVDAELANADEHDEHDEHQPLLS